MIYRYIEIPDSTKSDLHLDIGYVFFVYFKGYMLIYSHVLLKKNIITEIIFQVSMHGSFNFSFKFTIVNVEVSY